MPGDKPVLHRAHPVALGSEGAFVLCPDTHTERSLMTSSPENDQFYRMLGKAFLLIQFKKKTASYTSVTTERISRLDPIKFPTLRPEEN